MKTFLFAALFLIPAFATAAEPKPAVVIVPVADIWSEPSADPAKLTDDKRETQILFGEKVLIHDSSGPWVRIEAVEQPEFTHHNKWEGYPGWVKSDALDQKEHIVTGWAWTSTQKLLGFAATRVGTPYLWGGLDSRKGLDCSGLVHLAYRVNGMVIPRDSYEQWMKAKPLKRKELKPGDLIFSAKATDPKKITHVALFIGFVGPPENIRSNFNRENFKTSNEMLIEAPQTGMVVRQITFKEKYGKALDEVESGDHVGERVIYFGSFLH